MFALFGWAHCWTIEDNGACYIIRDNGGQALSYVYYEEEPGPRSAAGSRERHLAASGTDRPMFERFACLT